MMMMMTKMMIMMTLMMMKMMTMLQPRRGRLRMQEMDEGANVGTGVLIENIVIVNIIVIIVTIFLRPQR